MKVLTLSYDGKLTSQGRQSKKELAMEECLRWPYGNGCVTTHRLGNVSPSTYRQNPYLSSQALFTMQTIHYGWLAGCLLLAVACSSPQPPDRGTPATLVAHSEPDFGAYWYAGKAELSRYTLQQARYGSIHSGEAVLIFVTEDFLTDRQVKLESEPTNRSAPVLKLNLSRKFVTGIYDYSLFTSVFTPIQADRFSRTLKVTTSVQDWCGQTYSQLNYRRNRYQVADHSYFQNEADQQYAVEGTWLEDELWTRIRLGPQTLPTGEVRLIPGTATARLRHQRLQPRAARAELRPFAGNEFAGTSLLAYTLTYPDRTLRIVFEKAFPHLIAGWEETYADRNQTLTTRAVRTRTMRTDYWTKNAPQDTTLRTELGVKQ